MVSGIPDSNAHIPDFTGKRFRDFGIRIIFDWANHRETNDKQILFNRKQRKPLILNVFRDLSLEYYIFSKPLSRIPSGHQ